MSTEPGAGGSRDPNRKRRRETRAGRERRFEGLGVSGGVAIGTAHVVDSGMIQVPEYRLAAKQVDSELIRFAGAVALAHGQIRKMKAKAASLAGAAAEELGYLLEAHLQMLSGSRLIRGVEHRIKEQRVNAEAAVHAEIQEINKGFVAIGDPYLAARADDIREAGARLIRNLTKTPHRAFSDLPRETVIIADEITPADTALMDPRRVAGFATLLGGPESHTAIMARSLGLPAVLGAANLMDTRSGESVIIDGGAGVVIINPLPATVSLYRAKRVKLRREHRLLARLRDLPAITRDSVEIALQANIELPMELEAARRAGAEGIGLLRSEFLYMNRDDLPGEDEQYAALRDIVLGMEGRPVTVRTLDLGGDKLARSLGEHVGEMVNPALGLRAIRLSLKVKGLLEPQLAAMLRAAVHGKLRILLPMISTAGEVRQVRDAIKRVARRLRKQGFEVPDPLPPLGVMIEVPSAALASDGLARTADFFSIGTNDLTMYTLAIDRGDEQVAHLYDPLHPAVLRLIQIATEAALRARLPVNLCGEMAGDPRYTALLLGLGLRDLSMAVTQLPRIKQRIRSLDLTEASRRARTIMDQSDSGRIAALLDDFNALA